MEHCPLGNVVKRDIVSVSTEPLELIDGAACSRCQNRVGGDCGHGSKLLIQSLGGLRRVRRVIELQCLPDNQLSKRELTVATRQLGSVLSLELMCQKIDGELSLIRSTRLLNAREEHVWSAIAVLTHRVEDGGTASDVSLSKLRREQDLAGQRRLVITKCLKSDNCLCWVAEL